MNYIIDFLPEAERDVQDTYDWYEEQLSGLGEDFLLSADEAINEISGNPGLCAVIYKGVRKIITRRFPFGVFYILNENVITVIAIVHLARHSRTWKKRTKKLK